jgi:hypothetical protein
MSSLRSISSTPGRLAGIAGAGALLAATMAWAPAIAQVDTAPAPVVEAARQVTTSADPLRVFPIPTVAVDPRDPKTVVVVVGDARNGGCGLRVSRDGGLSWTLTAKTLMPPDLPYCVHSNFGSYVAPAFAPDGTLYVALSGSTAADHPNGPVTALVARTKDLGETVETSIVAVGRRDATFTSADGKVDSNLMDLHKYASIAVDPLNPNIVYRGWDFSLRQGAVAQGVGPRQPMVSVSTDGARTWSPAVDVSASLPDGAKTYAADLPYVVVGADHTAYAFMKEIRGPNVAGNNRMFMSKSTDNGKTWTASVISPGVPVTTSPVAALDPYSGRLYVAWDQREGPNVGPQQVLLMSSIDGGGTWTEPHRFGPSTDGYDRHIPGISVAPNGRVDVTWFDFRNDPAFTVRTAAAAPTWGLADVYLSSSRDGGVTWSPDLKVSDRSIDARLGIGFSSFQIRGPIGVAATDSATYVVWPDVRAGDATAQAEDAYLTRVRFDDTLVTSATEASHAPWIALGAAIALVVGGLALGAVTLAGRQPTAGRRPGVASSP